MAGCASFCVRAERRGRVHRLTPVGELDIATAEVFKDAFRATLADGAPEAIVVDLGEVTFMDSTGLRALLEMSAAAGPADRLRLVGGSPAVERLFDIAGVRDLLPIGGGAGEPPAG